MAERRAMFQPGDSATRPDRDGDPALFVEFLEIVREDLI